MVASNRAPDGALVIDADGEDEASSVIDNPDTDGKKKRKKRNKKKKKKSHGLGADSVSEVSINDQSIDD